LADVFFDTTVFIDYYRGDAGAKDLIDAVIDGSLTASYSSLTSFEIWIGIDNREEEIDFLAMLSQCEEAPLTAAMARTAAIRLKGFNPRRAEGLFRDALIAATANERGETIYTRNVRDFERLSIDVRTY
jgi:predicted nucleic acid-binding protein